MKDKLEGTFGGLNGLDRTEDHHHHRGTEAVSELLCESGCAGTVIEDRQDLLNIGGSADWDYVGDEVYEAFGEEAVVRGYLPKDATNGGYRRPGAPEAFRPCRP